MQCLVLMRSKADLLWQIVQVAPYQVYGAFLAGRFIAGVSKDLYSKSCKKQIAETDFLQAAVGALSALVPLYQGEISPKTLRGGFTSLYQLMITIGILSKFS